MCSRHLLKRWRQKYRGWVGKLATAAIAVQCYRLVSFRDRLRWRWRRRTGVVMVVYIAIDGETVGRVGDLGYGGAFG